MSEAKFHEQYPRAFPHFVTDDGFMKGSAAIEECVECEAPTTWFHKALGLYFCSRACHERYEAKEGRRTNPNCHRAEKGRVGSKP
jgi:hypothetical protein